MTLQVLKCARSLAVAHALALAVGTTAIGAGITPATAAPQAATLYSFKGDNDGAVPYGTLVGGPDGALYGTTSGGGKGGFGTIFKLTPPKSPATQWTETVLYHFVEKADGIRPEAGLIIDADGVLYGTATQGGEGCDCGVVFKLTPPARPKGAWKYAVIHRLEVAEGSNPYGGVMMGPDGSLYVTTIQGGHGGSGTVFRLQPRGKKWKYTLLHEFAFGGTDGANPFGGLVFDKKGALYGVTEQGGDLNSCFGGCGVVFRLTPSGKTWQYDILRKLVDADGSQAYRVNLVFDSKGALYGTASRGGANNWGTIFRLVPPKKSQTEWAFEVLHDFASATGVYPLAGLLIGPDGAFYGTAALGGSPHDGGTVFKLSKKGGRWQYSVLWKFATQTGGDHPFSALIADESGAFYTTTSGGGAFEHGAVIKVTP
jgi:uncharacterized repeat protein (TIGR03803 family)